MLMRGDGEASTSTPSIIHGHFEIDYPLENLIEPSFKPEAAFIKGRTLHGKPVFFPKQSPSQAISPMQRAEGRRLQTGFYQLICKIEEQAARKEQQQLERQEQHSLFPSTNNHIILPMTDLCNSRLWVDKYRPARFTDLLALDSTHVQVLQWASQWRDAITKQERHDPSADQKTKRLRAEPSLQFSPPSSSDPPEPKILLLCGPPGLGKTTLAQVVALAAGFELVQINASDERSGDAVLNKIRAAISCDSMLVGRRPNMLLIDEIDGALASGDKSLLSLLLRLATAQKRTGSKRADQKDDAEMNEGIIEDEEDEEDNQDENNDHVTHNHIKNQDQNHGQKREKSLKGTLRSAKKLAHKKKGTKPLQRPILCICNDLYTPALRPLRAVSQVIVLRKPTSTILAARLRQICQEEHLKLDIKTLLELVDCLGCDMRACLHALEFISHSPFASSSSSLERSRVASTILAGLKDSKQSMAAIYEAIFNSRTNKKELLDLLTMHDDQGRLAMGVFELYPQVKFHDDTRLSKLCTALDWLQWQDLLNGQERLMGYEPYALLKINRLLASPSLSHDTKRFPHVDYERHQQALALRQILRDYRLGLSPALASVACEGDLVLERIPALLTILLDTPKFRTANTQLLKEEERLRLRSLVSVMFQEGLTYRAVRQSDGTPSFILDPAIDRLADMKSDHTKDPSSREEGAKEPMRRPISKHDGAIRQMIAAELEMERIRRSRLPLHCCDPPVAPLVDPQSRRKDELFQAYADLSSSTQKALLSTIAPSKRTHPKTDFFGRPIIAPCATPQHPFPTVDRSVGHRVWFRHNEGFTNAIRRTIRIRDLFPQK